MSLADAFLKEFKVAKSKGPVHVPGTETKINVLNQHIGQINIQTSRTPVASAVAGTSALLRPQMKRSTVQEKSQPSNRDKIFISVASYRDQECWPTILDALQKAERPDRLVFGVCQQISADDTHLDVRSFIDSNLSVQSVTSESLTVQCPYSNGIPGQIERYTISSASGTAELHQQQQEQMNLSINVLTLDAGDAKGPMFARSLIERCLCPETMVQTSKVETEESKVWYLIIDSHMAFEPNWDQLLIDEISGYPENYILTTYPHDYHSSSLNLPIPSIGLKPANVPHQQRGPYNSYGQQRNVQQQQQQPPNGRPAGRGPLPGISNGPPTFLVFNKMHMPKYKNINTKFGIPQFNRAIMRSVPPAGETVTSLFWAACFSFGPIKMMMDVPYDPYCPYVFIGEEISMTVRLFTRGYLFAAPRRNVIYHLSTRLYRPTFWEQFMMQTKHDANALGHGANGRQWLPGQPLQEPINTNTSVQHNWSIGHPTVRTPQNQWSVGHNKMPSTATATAASKLSAEERRQRILLEQLGYERLRVIFTATGNGTGTDDQESQQGIYVPTLANLQLTGTGTGGTDNTLDLTVEDAASSIYGIGSVRTVDDFFEYCGIHLPTGRVRKHAQYGITPYASQEELRLKAVK